MSIDEVLTPPRRIVPPEGDPNAKLAIVGEAPGREEVELLRPWIGPAGRLLEEIMGEAGILRRHAYLTNVIKEKPPNTKKKNNDVSVFIDLSKKAPILTDTYHTWVKQLQEELSQTTCNLIVAAGGVAFYALCGMREITKRRGSLYDSTLLPGRKVLAIIHPAKCLYADKGGGMWMYRHYIRLDFERAKREMEFPELRQPDRKYATFPPFATALSFLATVKKYSEVAYDIEVVNQEVSHISFSVDTRFALSIVFISQGKHVYTLEEETEIWDKITELLEDANIQKVAQNAAYDNTFLFDRYGIRCTNTWDTMVGQAMVFPDFLKGLDFQCSIYTDEPYYKDERKEYLNIQHEQSFAEYNAKDSAVLLEIKPKLEEMLAELNNKEYAEEHMKLLEPLTYMETRGVLVDVKGLAECKEEMQAKLDELYPRFQELCGYDINPLSSQQVIKYFYVMKELKPYLKHGKPTCDDNALQRIVRRDGLEEAEVLREIRTTNTNKSNFVDLSLDPNQRLRCSWKIVGTKFSRFSSSEAIFGFGRNLQNFPREMRRFLLPDPGYMMYDLDLEQADWRVVAYLSKDVNMIQAAEEGKAHEYTASKIFNKPWQEISKVPGSAPRFGTGEFSERFWGKKANHAFNYRQSYKAFALQMLIPENDSKAIRDAYFSLYPGIRNTFWATIDRAIGTNRFVANLFGRTYYFQDRYGPNLLNSATSYIPQSTVADVMNRWAIIPMHYDPAFQKAELLMQVHDSVVFQIPVSIGWEAHRQMLVKLKQSLEQPLTYDRQEFKIPCDIGASPCNLMKVDETNPNGVQKVKWNEDIVAQLERIWQDGK